MHNLAKDYIYCARQLQSSQSLSKGAIATCMLCIGSFLGDELLSWCLHSFINRLTAFSATFMSTQPTEAFGLAANDLRFITEHFRFDDLCDYHNSRSKCITTNPRFSR